MYTVVWSDSALNDVARLWTNADSAGRSQITAATDEIDARLRRDPLHEGESRSGNRRILIAPPLAVSYHVEPQDRIARILDVWWFGRRS